MVAMDRRRAMTQTIVHKTSRFIVTLTDVRSANEMFTLDAVSHCRLRRPLLTATAVAVLGLAALVSVWWDDLYGGERVVFTMICAAALIAASQVARLQLMSLQLRDETYIYGSIREMRALKAGIERALIERARSTPSVRPQGVRKP
jgi:hypothetical protein